MESAFALEQDSVPSRDDSRAGDDECEQARTSSGPRRVSSRPVAEVAAVLKGATDCRGEPIEQVFFKRSEYAIYLSGGDVVIQYADDAAKAKQQIDATADLIPLRDKLRFMIRGRKVPGCYRPQIADAFRLTLEGKPLVAEEILVSAIGDVLSYKARVGRTTYLAFAGPLALALSLALLVAGAIAFGREAPAVGRLLLAASGGAMGALLSIAIALRTRTVAVDDDARANWLDGLIRIFIGTISGGVLMLVLVTGVVASINMSMVQQGRADLAWQAALIVGFAAGFFERLVPDLLAKSFDSKPRVAASHAIGQQAAQS